MGERAPHGRTGEALLAPLRRMVRAGRACGAALDRSLHPLRRRRLLRRLASARPRSVLFVCHGNICRSPYAEHRFRAALAELGGAAPRAESAGFVGPDRPAPEDARSEAERRGIGLGAHRSRLVTPTSLAGSDLVAVMDERQARRVRKLIGGARPDRVLLLGDLDPEPIRSRAIVDPWGRGEAVLLEVYDRIDRCVAVFARALAAEASRSSGPEVALGAGGRRGG